MSPLRTLAVTVGTLVAVAAGVMVAYPISRGDAKAGVAVPLSPGFVPFCAAFGADPAHAAFSAHDTIRLLVEPDSQLGDLEVWYRLRGSNLFRNGGFRWRPISGDSVELRHYHGASVRLSSVGEVRGRHVAVAAPTFFEYLLEGGAAGAKQRAVSGRRVNCESLDPLGAS